MKKILLMVFAISCLFAIELEGKDNFLIGIGEVSVFVFEDHIRFYNASLPAHTIAIQQQDEKLLVTALSHFGEAQLVVQVGDRFHKIPVALAASNQEADLFIDVRVNEIGMDAGSAGKDARVVEAAYAIKDAQVMERIAMHIERLQSGARNKQSVKIKDKNFGIGMEVLDAYTDEDHLYLELKIKNKTALVFDIASVRASYETVSKRRIFKPNVLYKVDVQPSYMSSEVYLVEAYSSSYYYTAIPIYALEKQGAFRLMIKEKNGMRDIDISIKPKVLSDLMNRKNI